MATKPPANEAEEQDAPKKKSKLPLILIAVLALGAGAGGAWFFMGGKPAKESHAEAKVGYEEVHERRPAKPATFVNLEPFTFNLLDEDQDRYAQIGVTLAVVDPAVEGELETLGPAVRDALLMLLTSKTSKQLLSVDGKRELGDQIIEFTNAVLARAPVPEIKMPKPPSRKKIKLKMKSDRRADTRDESHSDDRSYADRDDHDSYSRDDDRYSSRRRSRRRGPAIPERVYDAHFSKFLIQ